ncbi:uncharacterized protein LOC135928812 [Gordionus sp. m RMFG-2023]|uniref:uncharacterized protein LOC135928812 n=1 Tax=Gordionus sp. m RMFG-2023 TaxID=3053472 RepID=UPI0031FDC133
MLHILSVYAPQTGCKEKEKDDFRAILDEAVMKILKDDLVIIGGDLNAHVGKARDNKRHHGGFGYGEKNDEGEKKDSHLITYERGTRKTQIDYMLIFRRRFKDVIDCKVIPGEDIADITNKSTQNKIKLEPCIKWDEHSLCQNLIPPITEQKIIICLRHMKNKARGPDYIPIESLKALGDGGIHFLTNLYNKILVNEEFLKNGGRAI